MKLYETVTFCCGRGVFLGLIIPVTKVIRSYTYFGLGPQTRSENLSLKYHLVMTNIAMENPLSMEVLMGKSSINGKKW
jgi:hypothetical protein